MTAQPDPAALRALVEKATPGPFDHRDGLVRAIRGDMAVPLFEARPVYDPTVKAPTVRFPDGEVIFRAGSHDARHSFAEHQCRENGEALAAILNALPALLDERAADKARIDELEADAEVARILAMSPEEAMEGVTEQDIADMRNGVTVAVRLVEAEKRIAKLEAALEPFAAEADRWIEMGDTRPIREDTDLTVQHLRAARSALGGEGAE